MLKKTINFKDLDGNPTSKDYYFDLDKEEVIFLQLGREGGLAEYWTHMVNERDAYNMLLEFKRLIEFSYGERQADNVTFLKEDPITGEKLGKRFLQTTAYKALFLELFDQDNNETDVLSFLKGILPAEMVEKMPEKVELPEGYEAAFQASAPSAKENPKKTGDDHTHDELVNMSQGDFDELNGKDPKKWSQHVLQAAFARKTQAKS